MLKVSISIVKMIIRKMKIIFLFNFLSKKDMDLKKVLII